MNNLYFIDTETGGLKSYVHGLCSIYIKNAVNGYAQLLTFYPQKKVYEMGAFAVNGFTMDELYKNGTSRESLINTINNMYVALGARQQYLIFCGWNVMFDIEFITQVYKEKGVKLPCPIVAFDLKEIAVKNIKKKDGRKKDDDGVENHKLTTIYQHFFTDFDESKAHTADYDVLMTEKLYNKFKELSWI